MSRKGVGIGSRRKRPVAVYIERTADGCDYTIQPIETIPVKPRDAMAAFDLLCTDPDAIVVALVDRHGDTLLQWDRWPRRMA